MNEFAVYRDSLQTFHGTALQQSLTHLESLLRDLQNSHVPSDAYGLLPSSQVAHGGHTQSIHGLNDLITALRELTAQHAGHLHKTVGNYQASEAAALSAAQRIQA